MFVVFQEVIGPWANHKMRSGNFLCGHVVWTGAVAARAARPAAVAA